MNSNLFWWYLINTGTVLANAYFRFKPDYMKPFPMPASIPEDIEQNIIEYVDKIMESKSNGTYWHSDDKYEKGIDEIIYSLYGLTKDDIQLIEESTI